MSTHTTRKILLACAAWWMVLIVVEAYALVVTFGFTWRVALIDIGDINLLIATAGNVMFNSLRYYQPSPKKALYIFAGSVALAALCGVAHDYLMGRYLWQDELYLSYLKSSHVIRSLFSWLMITIIAVLSWIWFYMKDQQAGEKREQDSQKLAREAELASLQQKLQPHFLFNSLNSISSLAGTKPEAARKMIQQLSDFLRGTIKRDDQQLVTFEEEVKHLELYLEIEKVRFGYRLKTETDYEADVNTSTLPSLLLQPLVENAIKFGLYDTVGEITIRIAAKKLNDQLIITIENPFDPETAQPRKGTGFGLNSVQRRLYLLYARNDLMTTEQLGKIFKTEVKIPQPA
jgi:two-component system, LytTR family, sensor kinase